MHEAQITPSFTVQLGEARVPRSLLERRWQAVWKAMEAQGYDALVVAGRGAITEYGDVFYLSGFPLFVVHGYVFLPRGEPAKLVVGRRSQPLAKLFGVGGLVWRADLTDVITLDSGYAGLAGELAALVKRHGFERGKIGVVGMNQIMPAGDLMALRALQPHASFEEATGLLAPIKAVKSDEELALYRQAYGIVDQGFQTYLDRVAPGRTEAELAAAVEETVRRHAVLHTIIRVLSGQMYPRFTSHRKLGENELVFCYVEATAPNGFWVEKGAMFKLGSPPDRAMEVYAASERAYVEAEQALTPGRTAGEIGRLVRRIAEEAGCQTGIWAGHGVGVDHDIPTFSETDPTRLVPGMTLSLHPHICDDEFGALSMDVYQITETQPIRTSRFERRLYEV